MLITNSLADVNCDERGAILVNMCLQLTNSQVKNHWISAPVEMEGFQSVLLTAPVATLTLQWKQRG